ncbi:hypothetical protein VE23_13290 [Paenibacillus sp. D9]|nr:hypothetical protein VE23_13290 [Paenibacillus sp. D9]
MISSNSYIFGNRPESFYLATLIAGLRDAGSRLAVHDWRASCLASAALIQRIYIPQAFESPVPDSPYRRFRRLAGMRFFLFPASHRIFALGI